MAKFGKTLISLVLMAFGFECFAAAPSWVIKNPALTRTAIIESINKESPADLITIDTGAESKLQIGAVCAISRDGKQLAKVVVIEANADKAVAMVIAEGSIQKGDLVQIILVK